MAEKEVGRPKVSFGNMGKVKHINKEFVQVGSNPEMGGFTSDAGWPSGSPSMALEKGGPQAQKGKPI